MFSVLALLLASPVADPMAPARQGKILCQAPEEAFKSCASMVSYAANGNGVFRYRAQLLIDPGHEVVVHTRGQIRARGARICEAIRLSDFDSYRITIAGQAAPEETSADVRFAMRAMFAAYEGNELCSEMYDHGDGYLEVQVIMGGQPAPQLNSYAIWVDPDDGWTIG